MCFASVSPFRGFLMFLFLFYFLNFWNVVTFTALPFFSKCFPFPPVSVHVPHLPCWSHLFPKDYKCNEWRYHKKKKGKRKEIREFMYLEGRYGSLHYLPEGCPSSSVTSRKESVESGWLITSFTVQNPGGVLGSYFLWYFR